MSLSVFREQYLHGLVRWLDLDESVMPVMGAFLSGLGFEGSDTFLSILQAEPLLAAGATPIVQVFVTNRRCDDKLKCSLKLGCCNTKYTRGLLQMSAFQG